MKLSVFAILSLMLFVSSSSLWGQELTKQQKADIKTLQTYLERAEKNLQIAESSLKVAARQLDALEAVAVHPEVQKAKAKYDALCLHVKQEKSAALLKGGITMAAQKIKQYPDPTKLTATGKRQIADVIKQMQAALAVVREAENNPYAEVIQKSEEAIAQLQKLAGEDGKTEPPADPNKVEPPKTEQPKPQTPATLSNQEKNALARLKTIFSFTRRYMGEGRALQKSYAEGNRLSSGRFTNLLGQLSDYVKQAEPHIKVLSEYPDKHPEPLAAYRELVELTEALTKAYEDVQRKETDAAASDSLKFFENYLAKLDAGCSGYQKAITNDPEGQAVQTINSIKFNLGKADTELQEAKRRNKDHPAMAEAEKKLEAAHKKAEETMPQIARFAILQQAGILLNKAREASKYRSHDLIADLRRADQAYENALAYLQKNQRVAGIPEFVPQAEQELAACRQAQMRALGEATLRTIEEGHFNWIATRLNEARELAGSNEKMLLILKEYQPKIVAAACKKAMAKYGESANEDLDYWYRHFWQPIIKAAEQPELRKTVEEQVSLIVIQQLDMGLKALANKELGPAEQLEIAQRCRKNAKYLIAGNAELTKIEQSYALDFEPGIKQAEERLAQLRREQAEQEKLAREKFEKDLLPEQSAIYTEWGKQHPVKISQQEDKVCWLYIKPDETNEDANIHHYYFFDAKGKLLRKDQKAVGGGKVYGYRDSSSWTQIAEVKKDGKVWGYRDSFSWAHILEIKPDGTVYGYRDSSSWSQIGEIRADGSVYGYRDSSSWTQIAECKDKVVVHGYRGSSSWAQIAEIRADGNIYGYTTSTSWSHIAEMKVPDHLYRLAVLIFLIYRY
jgi:hypothetical protein